VAGESRALEGEDVFIVGAGNSAGQAALHLASHARTVTLLVRGESFARSMSSYLVQAIESTSNIAVRHSTEVLDGYGKEWLEGLRLADRTSGVVEEVPATALFIMIGGEPNTEWLPDEMARDQQNYLITGHDLLEHHGVGWEAVREPLPMETSMPGVFAAGDVRRGALKRVAAAVGEGSTIVRLLHDLLGDDARGPTSATAADQQAVATTSLIAQQA
jgi:thioredoxin reductase (NADPH)